MKTKTFQITEDNRKTSEIMAEMRSLFKVWSYYDDERLNKDFPPPKEITTREFPYSIEPTELGKSANDDKDMTVITLRERLLLEIQYFKETDSHLDIKGWTICSGSRNSDGNVPSVDFDPSDDEVKVNWYDLDDSHPMGGLRQAVLPSKPSDLEKRVTAIENWIKGF